MATALEQDGSEYYTQVMACSLCSHELKNPKLLPCQHSFCMQCLLQRHDKRKHRKPFCCPTCQKEIELEDDAVESLPDNYLYDIIKEADGQGVDSKMTCIPCNEGNTVITATHKCLDCGDSLCQHCREYHCRLTVTKHHVVVALADLKGGKFQDEFSKRKVLNCNLHSTEEHRVPLSSYCNHCKCLVCVECMQSDHQEHKFSRISLVREKHQKSCDENISEIESSLRDQIKRMNNIQKAVTDTRQKWNQQEAEIYDTATELYAMIDKIKDEKLSELKLHYQKELQKLDELLKEEISKKSCLQATVAFSKTFLEKCSDSDYLFHEDDIQSRMEDSQRELKDCFKRDVVSFDKQDISSVTEVVGAAFGTIKTHSAVTLHKCRIAKVKEKFKKSHDISGIYGLFYNQQDEEILVSGNKKEKSIMVLNKDGISRKKIGCENADRSLDIHFKNNQIFYTTFSEKNRKVFWVDLNGVVRKSVMLPDDDQNSNYIIGLTVDHDNTAFIASNNTDRIYKWSPDEDILSIFLSKDMGHEINSPTYLCLTPTGDLVVSNRGNRNIVVYSKEGELQWRYDGKLEEAALINPYGICCDRDGYIYVMDRYDCRIHVIHDQKLIGTIPVNKEVNGTVVPLTLTPDEDLIYGYNNNLVKVSFWGNDEDL